MKPIQLVDLQTQYEKIQAEIDSAVINVIRSAAFINGPEVKKFQQNLETFLHVKHVIPCANGTDALQIALMAAGLKPGDEVITPSFTYIATAEVIALLNLKPIFVEVHPEYFTLNPQEVEASISPKTKAIIPVHLYGQCAPMDQIMEIAQKHNLVVIEDNAQAIGANYYSSSGKTQKAGTIGHMGCTSFFPSKNLGCYGDGGAIFTNDDTLAEQIRMIANHGQKKKYYHDVIGVNSRLDSIQAAILDIKLKHLNSYIQARQHAANHYNQKLQSLPQIKTPKTAPYTNHTYHQYTMIIDTHETRENLMNYLTNLGIPCNVYYPLPIHKQKGFSSFEVTTNLSKTEDLCQRVLSLPIHTELSDDQLNFITDCILNFFNK